MASVRNMSDPEPPTSNNIVLYQMMMHYKRRMEIAEDREQHYKKRMKIEEELYTEEIQVYRQGNERLINQLQRTQFLAIRKHDAGMRLVNCLDDMFSAVELARDTDLGGPGNLAVEYIDTIKEQMHSKATVAFELLVGDHDEEEVDEGIIDLATTEEESEED